MDSFITSYCEKLWLASKTMSESVFNDTMSQIERTNRSAFDYLNTIEKVAWTRLYSTLPRFGHVTSNVAECFNSWIDSARDESHFRLVVSITRQIMTLVFQRRTSYSTMTSLVPRSLQKEFNEVMQTSGSLTCFPASEDKFLIVSGSSEFTLDLASRRCSCGEFYDKQRPCVHACSAFALTGKTFMDYVEHFYKKPSLINVYAGIVQPVPIDALRSDGLLPPITRAQAGRPKKGRHRDRSELQSEDSPIVCSLCGARGHNKRTCQRRQRGERIERH